MYRSLYNMAQKNGRLVDIYAVSYERLSAENRMHRKRSSNSKKKNCKICAKLHGLIRRLSRTKY